MIVKSVVLEAAATLIKIVAAANTKGVNYAMDIPTMVADAHITDPAFAAAADVFLPVTSGNISNTAQMTGGETMGLEQGL